MWKSSCLWAKWNKNSKKRVNVRRTNRTDTPFCFCLKWNKAVRRVCLNMVKWCLLQLFLYHYLFCLMFLSEMNQFLISRFVVWKASHCPSLQSMMTSVISLDELLSFFSPVLFLFSFHTIKLLVYVKQICAIRLPVRSAAQEPLVSITSWGRRWHHRRGERIRV